MSKNVDRRAITVSVKIYEWLLLAYPPAFRQKFAAEMKQLFVDQCRDAWRQGGGWGLAGLWLRVLLDWTRTSVLENIWELKQEPALMRIAGLVLAGAFVYSVLTLSWSAKIYSSVTRIEVSRTGDQSRRASIASPYSFIGRFQIIEPFSVLTNVVYKLRTDGNFFDTQIKIIESYTVLTNVISNLGLDEKLARQNGFKRWTVNDWTVVRSCSLFQPKNIGVATAGQADFGCEKFLEGNAFG